MTTPSQPRHEVRLWHDQRVPVRDGLTLSADVYLPVAKGPFPTIYQWTPYESTRERFIEWGVWFASRGYAAVVQDVCGRYESEGRFSPYLHEGRDAYDALDWAAAQPWCNGRVGTWGRSYGAIVQWQLAPLQPPALACMAPHVIADDYFSDYHYPGGAFQLALSLGAALIWATSLSTVTLPPARDLIFSERVLRHLPLIELDEQAIGRRLPYWREWLEHQTNDAYWQGLRPASRHDRVTVPVFQQCGWYDAYAGSTLRAHEALAAGAGSDLARASSRVLMGPWSHEEEVSRTMAGYDFGSEAVAFVRDHELRWYDRWLRDVDSGLDDEPPLSLFTMGANRWRRERRWPLPQTRFTPFFLDSGGRANTAAGDGTLRAEPPRATGEDRYDYDPDKPAPTVGGNNSLLTMMAHSAVPAGAGPADQAPLEGRDDVLCYTGPELEAELELTGPIEAVLYAASSARDTDFVVRVCDVDGRGCSRVLSEGIVRARYRDSETDPEPLEPGEVAEYRIAMHPTSMLLARGHRLRVTVTSSNFPRFSRNLNTGEDVATSTRKAVARQTVLHGPAYPSHVVLPVVPA